MGVGMKGDTRRGQSEKEWWNNHEVDVWSVRGVLSSQRISRAGVVVDVKRICVLDVWNCGQRGLRERDIMGSGSLVISMRYLKK